MFFYYFLLDLPVSLKRELKIRSLKELSQELDFLTDRKVQTHGVWSFYQILNHLKLSLLWASGEKVAFLPENSIPRPELGRKLFARMANSGRVPSMVNELSPKTRQEGDAAQEMKELKKALKKFQEFSGRRPTHPLFGEFRSEEWELWAAIHCSHHLGFASVDTL